MNLRLKGDSVPSKGEDRESNAYPNKELQWADYEAVGIAVYTLELLRAGDHARAIRLLETQLDRSVVFLTASIRRTAERDRDPRQEEMVQKAREYRTKYPGQPGPIADAVARGLRFVERQT